MTPTQLLYLFTGFIILEFLLEKYLDWRNARHFKDPIPAELADVYDAESYQKSQAYKAVNYRFGFWTSLFSFVIIILILLFRGFGYLDNLISEWTSNTMLQSLYFFGILLLISSLVQLPISYYHTFVIENRFGFNRSTRKLFFMDQIKSLLVSIILGGVLLTAIMWIYQKTGTNFWLWAWGVFAVFTIFINMFYTELIVPLFNKLTPLEAGELKDKLQALAQKTDYQLDKIYIIDGSKRSSKANAYFSGFGPKKKVVLYDTLVADLTPDEITAVLAHEIGHYKHRHIIYNLLLSLLITGVMLYLFSYVIQNDILAQALGVSHAKFHINLIAFALLFTPVSFF